jgi:hypothetical protein
VDTEGNVSNVKSLVAVNDSSFTLSITETDRRAFIQLDSIYKDWRSVNKRPIVFSKIKGYREGEKTHMPLGIKVPAASSK